MTETHDVVVIGGGHNGLVAANYLADAEVDVVVVEADERIGGMTASGCTVRGAPGHVMNHCGVDPIFWDLFRPARDLALERHGLRKIRADPCAAYLDPDGSSIAFWEDPRRTADEIRRFSVADSDAYIELVADLRAFSDFSVLLSRVNPTRLPARLAGPAASLAWRHRRRLGNALHFAVASAEEVINERFRHPMVRAALHVVGGVLIPNSLPGTAFALFTIPSFHRACWRPEGGTQAIPDALASRLAAASGTIRTSSPVAEILVEESRAGGVRLVDGTEIRARTAVLATCDPVTALGRLLPARTLPAAMEHRVRAIPTNAAGYGQIKVDVALSGRLDMTRFTRWRRDALDMRLPSHIIGSEDGIARAFGRAGAGLLPDTDDLPSWNAIPTALDPTQAPGGQDTLYLYCQTVPARPEKGWETIRDEAAQRVIDRASTFYGGLTELEIGRHVQTNEDLARSVGATGGQIAHVDWILSRIGPLRPARGLGGYRTPVTGLYLGGAGSHPGGGITGMPGYHGAREILSAARSRSRPAH